MHGAIPRADDDVANLPGLGIDAAQARARLQYVRPGETGYVVLDAPAAWDAEGEPTGATVLAGGERRAEAWYAELWGSVETAGQP